MSFDLDYVSQEFHKKTGKTLNNYYLRGLADMYNINTVNKSEDDFIKYLVSFAYLLDNRLCRR